MSALSGGRRLGASRKARLLLSLPGVLSRERRERAGLAAPASDRGKAERGTLQGIEAAQARGKTRRIHLRGDRVDGLRRRAVSPIQQRTLVIVEHPEDESGGHQRHRPMIGAGPVQRPFLDRRPAPPDSRPGPPVCHPPPPPPPPEEGLLCPARR